MGIHVPTLLEGILDATAAKAAAEARITVLRAELEAEGRRRLTAEGAAPSWTTPRLGKVRLDPPGEWTATVADPAAFGSYVAQHHPSEATAVLRLPAALLPDALEALGFAGMSDVDTAVEVRPAWVKPYLEGLAVDVEETQGDDGRVDRAITVADPDTGALVDGLTATRAAAKLVVSLDRDRRQGAIAEATAGASALVEEATADDAPAADGEAIRARRIDLEGMHADTLATIAKAHGLGSSGTKAALAERIARAEADTGHVIRPAATLTAPAARQPDGLRNPYVGEGADGCLRSAQIDREELGGLDRDDPRVPTIIASVEAWEAQAAGYPRTVAEFTAEDEAAAADEPDPVEALMDGRSREVLRHAAKARGLPTGGSKRDVATALADAGVTAAEFNPTTAQEATP